MLNQNSRIRFLRFVEEYRKNPVNIPRCVGEIVVDYWLFNGLTQTYLLGFINGLDDNYCPPELNGRREYDDGYNDSVSFPAEFKQHNLFVWKE